VPPVRVLRAGSPNDRQPPVPRGSVVVRVDAPVERPPVLPRSADRGGVSTLRQPFADRGSFPEFTEASRLDVVRGSPNDRQPPEPRCSLAATLPAERDGSPRTAPFSPRLPDDSRRETCSNVCRC
jgi:hypothetical protein